MQSHCSLLRLQWCQVSETTIREIYSPSPSPFFPYPPSAWKETPEIQLKGLSTCYSAAYDTRTAALYNLRSGS